MADFNIADLFSRNIFSGGGAGGASGGGEIKANEHETPQLLIEGASNLINKTSKFVDAIPLLGPLFSWIFPKSVGKSGLNAGLETEGFASKSINPGKGGLQGSNIYNAIIAPLVANKAITPHTEGIQQLAWADVPHEQLGTFTPMSTGSGASAGAGMDLA